MLLEIRFKNHIKKEARKTQVMMIKRIRCGMVRMILRINYYISKTSFLCLCRFVFSVYSKFDVIFINFCNICIIIIYIAGVRYSVFLFWLITSNLNNLWEQIHVIKTIVYKKTDNWYIEWRVTANDNEW